MRPQLLTLTGRNEFIQTNLIDAWTRSHSKEKAAAMAKIALFDSTVPVASPQTTAAFTEMTASLHDRVLADQTRLDTRALELTGNDGRKFVIFDAATGPGNLPEGAHHMPWDFSPKPFHVDRDMSLSSTVVQIRLPIKFIEKVQTAVKATNPIDGRFEAMYEMLVKSLIPALKQNCTSRGKTMGPVTISRGIIPSWMNKHALELSEPDKLLRITLESEGELEIFSFTSLGGGNLFKANVAGTVFDLSLEQSHSARKENPPQVKSQTMVVTVELEGLNFKRVEQALAFTSRRTAIPIGALIPHKVSTGDDGKTLAVSSRATFTISAEERHNPDLNWKMDRDGNVSTHPGPGVDGIDTGKRLMRIMLQGGGSAFIPIIVPKPPVTILHRGTELRINFWEQRRNNMNEQQLALKHLQQQRQQPPPQQPPSQQQQQQLQQLQQRQQQQQQQRQQHQQQLQVPADRPQQPLHRDTQRGLTGASPHQHRRNRSITELLPEERFEGEDEQNPPVSNTTSATDDQARDRRQEVLAQQQEKAAEAVRAAAQRNIIKQRRDRDIRLAMSEADRAHQTADDKALHDAVTLNGGVVTSSDTLTARAERKQMKDRTYRRQKLAADRASKEAEAQPTSGADTESVAADGHAGACASMADAFGVISAAMTASTLAAADVVNLEMDETTTSGDTGAGAKSSAGDGGSGGTPVRRKAGDLSPGQSPPTTGPDKRSRFAPPLPGSPGGATIV